MPYYGRTLDITVDMLGLNKAMARAAEAFMDMAVGAQLGKGAPYCDGKISCYPEHLTGRGDGTVNEIDGALEFFWRNHRQPLEISVGGALLREFHEAVLVAGFAFAGDAADIGGMQIVKYRSRFTGDAIPVQVHSDPPGSPGSLVFTMPEEDQPADQAGDMVALFEAVREIRITDTAERATTASGLSVMIQETAFRFKADLIRRGYDVGDVTIQQSEMEFATMSRTVRFVAELF